MRRYRLGFSPHGLLAVALVMLPNLFYLFFTPPIDALAHNDAAFWLWNALENLGRFGLMAALTLVVRRTGKAPATWLPAAATLALLGYYTLWVLYFLGGITGPGFVGMAVLPSLFFLFVSLWLRNGVAVGFAVLFGLVHTAITASNFLLAYITV